MQILLLSHGLQYLNRNQINPDKAHSHIQSFSLFLDLSWSVHCKFCNAENLEIFNLVNCLWKSPRQKTNSCKGRNVARSEALSCPLVVQGSNQPVSSCPTLLERETQFIEITLSLKYVVKKVFVLKWQHTYLIVDVKNNCQCVLCNLATSLF